MVQLIPASDNARITRDAGAIVQILRRFTDGDQEVAYRSQYGHTFGMAFRTDQNPAQLFNALTTGTHFLAGDSAVIVEVGGIIGGRGASRLWTWLQHHL